MRHKLIAALAATTLAVAPFAAEAAGNLATQPTTIELAIDGRNLTFSQTEFQLETGKYYRWVITSDGVEEVMIQSPELFRNAWVNQIVFSELEYHANGGFYGVEFDDEGTVVIFFIPIRPGNYEFFVPGFEDRGLRGTFVVR
jgi:hypothetical protein